jgi:HAD superfamily hydrolase (TIGR01509 family)
VIAGVLFDLDGTLADTEPIQWESYRRALRAYGADVDLETYRRHWIAVEGGSEWACRTFALPVTPAELRARKTVEYSALIADGVPARPGAREALARLAPEYALAVATNSIRSQVDVVLGHLGFRDAFKALVAREDYVEAKPAPDPYLEAARRLGLAPEACVVVEDTARGVRSGLAAGCVVVAVPSELTRDNDFTGAARRLDGLDALTPALLRDLSRTG